MITDGSTKLIGTGITLIYYMLKRQKVSNISKLLYPESNRD